MDSWNLEDRQYPIRRWQIQLCSYHSPSPGSQGPARVKNLSSTEPEEPESALVPDRITIEFLLHQRAMPYLKSEVPGFHFVFPALHSFTKIHHGLSPLLLPRGRRDPQLRP